MCVDLLKIVMEYCGGGSVSDIIKRRTRTVSESDIVIINFLKMNILSVARGSNCDYTGHGSQGTRVSSLQTENPSRHQSGEHSSQYARPSEIGRLRRRRTAHRRKFFLVSAGRIRIHF